MKLSNVAKYSPIDPMTRSLLLGIPQASSKTKKSTRFKTSKLSSSSKKEPQAKSFLEMLTNTSSAPQKSTAQNKNVPQRLTAKQIADQITASEFKARGEPRYPYERVGDMTVRSAPDPASSKPQSQPARSLPRQSASDLAAQIIAAGERRRGE